MASNTKATTSTYMAICYVGNNQLQLYGNTRLSVAQQVADVVINTVATGKGDLAIRDFVNETIDNGMCLVVAATERDDADGNTLYELISGDGDYYLTGTYHSIIWVLIPLLLSEHVGYIMPTRYHYPIGE